MKKKQHEYKKERHVKNKRCRDERRTLTLLIIVKTFQAKQQNKKKEVTGIGKYIHQLIPPHRHQF